MRLLTCLTIALSLIALSAANEQQRILRRVIKSTPTATNLGRIRAVSVRSPAENGAVTEISSNEAAKFGERSANETSSPPQATAQAAAPAQQQQPLGGTKTKTSISTSTTTTTSTAAPTSSSSSNNSTSSITTTSAPATTTTTSTSTTNKPKASDRQQSAPQANEVELLSSAPSSWQTMTAVEAPVAMLIATGTRAAAASASSSNDLASSSSTLYSSEESASQTGDFLRSASTKGEHRASGETFSRLRQQHAISKQNQHHQHHQQQQQQQQQAFFYPQQQEQRAPSKINQQASKTPWYQTTTAAPRPAPIVQEQQLQFEQQNEQYVEQQQQQQIEYNAAPLGMAEPFAFDFKTLDNSGNGQYRKEESDKNGVVRGSYGYTDANGIYRHVDYVADQNGFRANIKSNEPGLIGETQPASIQLAGGAAPANNQRQSALRNNADNGDWVPSSSSSNNNNQGSSADLALAPPEFESSHKSQDRARLPRHFRN